MNALILAAGKDRPHEHDSIYAFQIGASRFQAINEVSSQPVLFDNTGEEVGHYAAVEARVLSAIATGGSAGPWEAVAVFCHGGADALWSAGLRGASGAQALANALRPRCAANVVIVLYACNAGQSGGFASKLANELSDLNATVYGHTSARHTFANPDTTVFPADEPVIARSSPLWKNWNDDIIDQSNDLWARFPFMTQAELEAELSAPEYLLGRWKVGTRDNYWNDVFFADGTVYQAGAADYNKYAIYQYGKWTADAHSVKVIWDGGGTEDWRLHLHLHAQPVRVGGNSDDGTRPGMYQARRIEATNVNQPNLFQPSGGGNTSEVAYA